MSQKVGICSQKPAISSQTPAISPNSIEIVTNSGDIVTNSSDKFTNPIDIRNAIPEPNCNFFKFQLSNTKREVVHLKRLLFLCLLATTICIITACEEKNINDSLKIGEKVAYDEEDYQSIVPANNELGFQLLSNVEPNEDGNLFISPLSLYMALSMVYNGADGETKEEMADVLNITMDSEDINKANASLMNALYTNSKDVTLDIANSIWLNEQYQFQDAFAKYIRDYFNGKIEEIDITDSESPKLINDWVKKATQGKIKEIVDSPLDPDLVAILMNAIYFKGDWTYPFDPNETENRTFHLADGSTKETPFMKKTRKWAYIENDAFQAVALPYGSDKNLSMKVILPKEDVDFIEFQQLLTSANWETWNKEFRPREGTIVLPKFQMEYEVELNEFLKDLGMKTAFHREANFSKMIYGDTPVWISKVKQKTYIDVNEEGTEAAAVTSVEMVTESAIVEDVFYMEVNRPFFIGIADDSTGTILFMGLIANPKVGE